MPTRGPEMMIYVNYPNPHFTLHPDDACPEIQKHQKEGQRVLLVTAGNLPETLLRFINSEIRFRADPRENDLWLNVSLPSPRHEESLIYVIQLLLGQAHNPFINATIETHACPGLRDLPSGH